MVFKLIPWNYPFSSWLGYGTLDMIEGGGHSHESSRTASALSHICNRVCRKIIRMPAYLSPHKRPKKRRDEKSGSAQQGEKLGCGHHHAETHQSPIETSSISPSYTYALCCCSEDGKFQPSRWTIRLEKVDSCEKVSLKIDVFLLHFFVFKEERGGMDVVVVSSFPQYHVAACTRFWPLLWPQEDWQRHPLPADIAGAYLIHDDAKQKMCSKGQKSLTTSCQITFKYWGKKLKQHGKSLLAFRECTLETNWSWQVAAIFSSHCFSVHSIACFIHPEKTVRISFLSFTEWWFMVKNCRRL